jgi:hypothetical protein
MHYFLVDMIDSDAAIDDFFLALMSIYIIDVLVRWYGLGWRSFRANGWNLFDIIVAFGSFLTTLIVLSGTTSFVTQQLQKLFLVSIAFKLVQRTNSLNMLFKTAVYVFTSLVEDMQVLKIAQSGRAYL